MKYLIPSWLMPVNIFEITGNMCCLNMYNSYLKNNFAHNFNCFNASSLFEANTCVIWGSISAKLAERLPIYLSYLPTVHFVIHIEGCQKTSEAPKIACQRIVERCALHEEDFQIAILEARQCLTA